MKYLLLLLVLSCSNINQRSREAYNKSMRHGIVPIATDRYVKVSPVRKDWDPEKASAGRVVYEKRG